MRLVFEIASGAARHAVAFGVLVVAGCIFWTVAYFTLFLWAVVAGAGIGSPVVYPIGIVAFFSGATVASLVLFLPATLGGEILCRWRVWPTLVGIPVTFALFCFLSLFWSAVAHLVRHFDQPSLWSLALGLIVTLAVPLGLYWWVAEFPQVFWDVARTTRAIWIRTSKITEPGAALDAG